MDEDRARIRYWRQSILLGWALLGVMLLLILIVIFGVERFNQYDFLRFPLGFYLAGQALLLIIAGAGFWFAKAQERLDQELSEAAEF